MHNALIDIDMYVTDRREQREDELLSDAGELTNALSNESYQDLTGDLLAMLSSSAHPILIIADMRQRRQLYIDSILEREKDKWRAEYYEGDCDE